MQTSRPWGGTTIGDAGPYSDNDWMRVWAAMKDPTMASQGVLVGQLNALVLTVAANLATIGTGRAFVDGSWYENDAALNVVVPDVILNPRVDRIVLRKDFAAQTVRVTRIVGAEAATPVAPAITQVAGVTWDLPLWQVYMPAGAGATPQIRLDERIMIGRFESLGVFDSYSLVEDDFLYSVISAASTERGRWRMSQVNGAIAQVYQAGFGEQRLSLTVVGLGGVVFEGAGITPLNSKAKMSFRVKTPATNALGFDRIGFFSAVPNGAAPDPAEGIYFRRNGAGNWYAVTRSAAAETATDTAQAPVNTYHIFEIHVYSTWVVYTIDGVIVAKHSTNIPAAATLLYEIINVCSSAGAAYDAMDIDWEKLKGIR